MERFVDLLAAPQLNSTKQNSQERFAMLEYADTSRPTKQVQAERTL